MAEISSLLGIVLRIMTPEEINELTSDSIEKGKISLTGLLIEKIELEVVDKDQKEQRDEEKEEDSGKVLEFKREGQIDDGATDSTLQKKEDAPDDKTEITAKKKGIESDEEVEAEAEEKKEVEPEGKKEEEDFEEQEAKKRASSSSTAHIFKEEEVVEEEKVDTTVFIIEEQERSKRNQRKLKEKEIRHLYKKNAQVSIEQEKKIKDDLSKSTHSGILVNRKHR